MVSACSQVLRSAESWSICQRLQIGSWLPIINQPPLIFPRHYRQNEHFYGKLLYFQTSKISWHLITALTPENVYNDGQSKSKSKSKWQKILNIARSFSAGHPLIQRLRALYCNDQFLFEIKKALFSTNLFVLSNCHIALDCVVLHDIAWMVRLRCHWCWNHLKSESVRCWFVLDRNKHKSCDSDAANKSGFPQERFDLLRCIALGIRRSCQ